MEAVKEYLGVDPAVDKIVERVRREQEIIERLEPLSVDLNALQENTPVFMPAPDGMVKGPFYSNRAARRRHLFRASVEAFNGFRPEVVTRTSHRADRRRAKALLAILEPLTMTVPRSR